MLQHTILSIRLMVLHSAVELRVLLQSNSQCCNTRHLRVQGALKTCQNIHRWAAKNVNIAILKGANYTSQNNLTWLGPFMQHCNITSVRTVSSAAAHPKHYRTATCTLLYTSLQKHGPGWRGAVLILSTVPTVDWVLLGSGESNKGQDFGSLCCSLFADAPCL